MHVTRVRDVGGSPGGQARDHAHPEKGPRLEEPAAVCGVSLVFIRAGVVLHQRCRRRVRLCQVSAAGTSTGGGWRPIPPLPPWRVLALVCLKPVSRCLCKHLKLFATLVTVDAFDGGGHGSRSGYWCESLQTRLQQTQLRPRLLIRWG